MLSVKARPLDTLHHPSIIIMIMLIDQPRIMNKKPLQPTCGYGSIESDDESRDQQETDLPQRRIIYYGKC